MGLLRPYVYRKDDTEPGGYLFWCPGCKEPHAFRTRPAPRDKDGPVWHFNGSQESPTFTPSLRVVGTRDRTLCHLFLRDGALEFCSDSPHELAGKTVPLPDIDEEDL